MNLEPAIVRLLKKRNIITDEEISEFLSEKPQKTYNPFLLLNMEAGVDLILSSIKNDEKICIYGDYDTDGITSTSVLLEVLSNLTSKLMYHIPSRFSEGYGLNCQALKEIKEAGASLVITVDCGSTSTEEVKYAKEIGLKILVTDHHTVSENKPDCLIINPKQAECPYPFKGLAGVGVAFKLAQAICEKTGLNKSIVNHTLDLVGIGTIGDIVPLVDENRTIAKYGLRAVRVSKRKGLVKLINDAGLKQKEVMSRDVSFVIVPHLNAAGRVSEASKGVELLKNKNPENIENLVSDIIKCNSVRKNLQEDTYLKCIDEVETKYIDDDFLIIDLESAHEGITGIVAGKIKDRYGKPTVILTNTEEGMLKGTGRSIENISLYDILKENDDLFTKFGGHKAACGFSMKKENLPTLRNRVREQIKRIKEADEHAFDVTLIPDVNLSAEEVTEEFVDQISSLEPFGCENPEPLVSVNLIPRNVRFMGREGKYISFSGLLEDNRDIKCVVFRNADKLAHVLQKGNKIQVVGALEKSEWNGRKYLQINVQCATELR